MYLLQHLLVVFRIIMDIHLTDYPIGVAGFGALLDVQFGKQQTAQGRIEVLQKIDSVWVKRVINQTGNNMFGGIFVFAVVGNWPMYLVSLAVGSVVSMLLLALLKKKKTAKEPEVKNVK